MYEYFVIEVSIEKEEGKISFKLFSSSIEQNLSRTMESSESALHPAEYEFNEKALSSPLLTCRPAKRRTPVNDRIRPFQQYLGRGKRGSPASCLAFSLSPSLSPTNSAPPSFTARTRQP